MEGLHDFYKQGQKQQQQLSGRREGNTSKVLLPLLLQMWSMIYVVICALFSQLFHYIFTVFRHTQ